MYSLIAKIEAAFENTPLVIMVVGNTNTVLASNRQANDHFHCFDMIDLPVSYFFPDWPELSCQGDETIIANTSCYDRYGIPWTVETILLSLGAYGKRLRHVDGS